MLDLDLSHLYKASLVESWYVELNDFIIDLSWSPNQKQLAAITVEGAVFLIEDHGDESNFKQLGAHSGGGNSVSWHCDGTEFATAGHDGLIKVWDAQNSSQIHELSAGDLWVSKATYSPKKGLLASAAGKHLKLWNSSRQLVYESSDHSSTIADIGWNPDGSGIAVAAYNGLTLHVPGKQTQPRKYVWKGSSLVLSWSPDSKYIASGEQDSTVHFWYVKSGEDAQMSGFPTKVLELSWDRSGRWLATGGGAVICLWDCAGKGPAGRRPWQYDAHLNRVTQLAFQTHGDRLASADSDGFLFLWEPLKHDKIIGGVGLKAAASCLRWNRKGALAVGQRDGHLVKFASNEN
ncbi:MAG: WD40 repeat domain-containing protein [Pirellula sp.]|nr:WD40 repeat domain-containing protein [Pirellula sp.]